MHDVTAPVYRQMDFVSIVRSNIKDHPNPPACSALFTVGAMNIPPFLGFVAIGVGSLRESMRAWPQSFANRWIVHYFPHTKQSQLEAYMRANVMRSLYSSNLFRNFSLSLKGFRQGQFWTLVTSNFAHVKLAHLGANMLSLYVFGDLIARVPVITATDICAITYGSAVSSSLAFLWHQSRLPLFRQGSAVGASGIVCGFAAVAALLVPSAPFYHGVAQVRLNVPCWLVVAAMVAGDIAMLDPKRQAKVFGSQDNVGHSAHLGGAAFGVLYYLLVLRRRPKTKARRASDNRTY